MVTKSQLDRLKRDLAKKESQIKRLQEQRDLEAKKVELIKEVKRVQDPKAFLRKQKTKRILKKIGRGTLKGAKSTFNFLGRLAEEDQRLGKLENQRKMKRRRKK